MATATAEPTSADPAATGAKKSKKLLLIPVIGLILGGSGLGGYFALHEKSRVKEAENEAKKEQALDKPKHGKIVTLNPIIVNLRDTRGTRYLKVSIGIETQADEVVDELKSIGPQLSDFLVDKLSSVRIEDVDNTEGRNRLKRELLAGCNDLLHAGVVTNLYFSEFVIQ